MRYNTLLTWGLALLMAVTLAMPAMAEIHVQFKLDNNKAKVRVTTRQNDQEDAHTFQQWYHVQTRDYQDVDAITGEHIGDLLQLVVDVSTNRVMISDQQNIRRPAFLSERTQILFPDNNRPGDHRGNAFRNRHHDRDIATMLAPGDLVIVEGYLRATGGIFATRIRVMGRAWGWTNDDDGWDNTGGGYGYRYFGDVQYLDARRGWVEVNTNKGRRRVSIGQDAVVIVNGNTTDLNALRRGDRVVFYANTDDAWSITAYRLSVLQPRDRYPEGDQPYNADPVRGGDHAGVTFYDGRLDSIDTTMLFNRVTLRGDNGRSCTILVGKGVEAITRDGKRISLYDLHDGDQLHIAYTESEGNFFAQRVELR